MVNVRKPAVAGSFYPDRPELLQVEVARLLNEATGDNIRPKALIVPHAGYMYSGHVAACAFRLLSSIHINRVILFGPSHRVALEGCAVPSCEYFETPLGMIKLDQLACDSLLKKNLVNLNDAAHQFEHSLEVQLPFLQFCLDEFSIIPIVVGYQDESKIKDIIKCLDISETDLILISTDLSHFHHYDEAAELDSASINKVLSLSASLVSNEACGSHAVNGFLQYMRAKKLSSTNCLEKPDMDWRICLLKYANSGDVIANKQEIVGYASFAVY